MPDHLHAVVGFISAGSNIEPRKQLDAATTMLLERVEVLAVSTVYRTPAIGRPDDPAFLNCVFQIRTALSPHVMKFEVLRDIERRLGRERKADKYAPRKIDLDVILYGAEAVDEPDLKLPHPDLCTWFVRVPLLELAPDIEVPGRGRLRDIHVAEAPHERGQPLPDFTEQLRRRLNQ